MTSTNRFNSILKDTTSVKIHNTSSSIIKNTNNFKTNRFVSKQINDERNKKQKEEIFIKSLNNLTEFPELQIKKKESIVLDNKNKSNFIDAIKMNNLIPSEENSNEIQNEEAIPPGCVCIQFDKTSNQQKWIYGVDVSKNEDVESVIEENPYFVFQRVTDLYNNRKNEHIKKWGIEEYDQMFMFQNYDYEYFDKLDEQK
jgi:hypothetical protein